MNCGRKQNHERCNVSIVSEDASNFAIREARQWPYARDPW
jgi:hypothetical protein